MNQLELFFSKSIPNYVYFTSINFCKKLNKQSYIVYLIRKFSGYNTNLLSIIIKNALRIYFTNKIEFSCNNTYITVMEH